MPVSEERRPLLRGLLHHGLRAAQLQPLFAAAGYQSDHSAKQRHNGDLAGVHGVTSNCNLTKAIMPPWLRHPKLRLKITVLFWLD